MKRALGKLLLTLTGCSTAVNPVPPITASVSTDASAVATTKVGRTTDPTANSAAPKATASPLAASAAQSISQFGIDLYGVVRDRPGNVAFSPASIAMALHMTRAGARGATERQMSSVLHSASETHAGYGQLLSMWNQSNSGYQLTVVNQLFASQSTSFEGSFLSLTDRDYGAKIESLDFRAQAEPARLHINQWVADKTKQHIKDLLPPRSITADTRLVLANAIYFKGTWKSQFDKSATAPAAFHRTTGDVQVPTMHLSESVLFSAIDDLQMVTLPYLGDTLSMSLIVPNAVGGFAQAEQKLLGGRLPVWDKAAVMTKVKLSLPRFSIKSTGAALQLKRPLQKLGMVAPFEDAADLSGMAASKPLFIADAFHKAFVEVNEEGTVAAAATATTATADSMPPAIQADRPFLFMIRDQAGTILFLGRVADPSV